MWISKKKLAAKEASARHEAFLESLKDEAAMRQWQEVDKLKKDVKKLKKIIKEGY